VPQGDGLTTSVIGLTRDGKTFYMVDSRDRDTAALFAVDWSSGKRTLLHQDSHADVGNVFVDPKTEVVRAVAVDYLRNEWTVLDPAISKDFAYLKTLGDGEVNIVSESFDDRFWVRVLTPFGCFGKVLPLRSFRGQGDVLVRRAPGAGARKTFRHAPGRDRGARWPEARQLLHASARNRSGRQRQSRAPGADGAVRARRAVGRDDYGYNSYHQWLANRGYAVLSVNYRASTGFGKAFVNAGDLQWGRKMHDDLLDSVDWAIQQGITTKGQGRDHGWQLRRLRDTGRPDDDAGRVRLRRRHRGSVQPCDFVK
jgi:hypothetical protein